MRLWLSKNSEVPLHEQLTTQIILGILSHDLQPGQRLPSTRELAQRLQIHANTVSAAYHDLVEREWLEYRKGSGVYVRPRTLERPIDKELELDALIAGFLQTARTRGYTINDIHSRVNHWLTLQPPDHFLLLEPDEALRRILIAEIEEATGFPVVGRSPQACTEADLRTGSPVAFYNRADLVKSLLPAGKECLLLRSRSVPTSLKGHNPLPEDALVTIVSGWPEFLRWARTILVAAGVSPDSLNLCDATEHEWQKRLSTSSLLITDALLARQIQSKCPVFVFRLIADSSFDELRQLRDFWTKPLS